MAYTMPIQRQLLQSPTKMQLLHPLTQHLYELETTVQQMPLLQVKEQLLKMPNQLDIDDPLLPHYS
jgi:hypothetical protein